jgi:hypothetical protein
VTPSGIKPATFRLLAQCLNQLRHVVALIWYRPTLILTPFSLVHTYTYFDAIQFAIRLHIFWRHSVWYIHTHFDANQFAIRLHIFWRPLNWYSTYLWTFWSRSVRYRRSRFFFTYSDLYSGTQFVVPSCLIVIENWGNHQMSHWINGNPPSDTLSFKCGLVVSRFSPKA